MRYEMSGPYFGYLEWPLQYSDPAFVLYDVVPQHALYTANAPQAQISRSSGGKTVKTCVYDSDASFGAN